MSYLSIKVSKDYAIAEQVLTRWQLIFYKAKLEGLYRLIKIQVGKYVTEEKPDYFITREEGEPDIIEQEVRKLKDFLFADESTFSDEKYKTYQKFTNDRIMRQVSAMAKRFIVKGQSKAMRAALQGNSVLSFLNSIGIIVEYESDVVSNEKRSL